MILDWIPIDLCLPKNNQRCLIWDKNCHCSEDGTPETIHHIYIATFYKGEHKPNGPWRSCDTGFGNNQFPWCWQESQRCWFSQDVTHWASIIFPETLENILK